MKSPKEIKTKVNEFMDYAKTRWHQELTFGLQSNYIFTVHYFTVKPSETTSHRTSKLEGYDIISEKTDTPLNKLYNSDKDNPDKAFTSVADVLLDSIDAYIKSEKNSFAELLETFMKEWYFFHDFESTEYENDSKLGIPVFTKPTYYWTKDWTKLILHNAFALSTITNLSKEEFFEGFEYVYVAHPGNNSNSVSYDKKYLVNKYIGFDFGEGVYQKGWIQERAKKRPQEKVNINEAIANMQNAILPFQNASSNIWNLFENRGSPKISSSFNVTVDNSPKWYNVTVRSSDGDTIEQRYGTNPTYTFPDVFRQLAQQIYLPELYGMFIIIRCLNLYTESAVNSAVPVSTKQSGCVYIPSYLKNAFKTYTKNFTI